MGQTSSTALVIHLLIIACLEDFGSSIVQHLINHFRRYYDERYEDDIIV